MKRRPAPANPVRQPAKGSAKHPLAPAWRGLPTTARRHTAYLRQVMGSAVDARPPLHMVWFAGGGGSSNGARQALGRDPDYALNHNATALRMHEVNHPQTVHLCADAYAAHPLELEPGRNIASMWFSPDCTHHSKARGAAPKSARIRGLAWCVIPWAKLRRPDVIFLENVEEFRDWCPLYPETHEKAGHADPSKKGATFRRFIRRLEQCGYVVEWRELVAADNGAPTTRKRFFLIARCDGQPIAWPERTHAPRDKAKAMGLKPWRGAHEIIDFSIRAPSIFMTQTDARAEGLRIKRPLVAATEKRIFKGIERYVVGSAEPFTVCITHHGSERVYSTKDPAKTVTGAHRGEYALVDAELTVANLAGLAHGETPKGGRRDRSVQDPLRAVKAQGGDHALVLTAIQPSSLAVKGGDFTLAAPFLTKFHTGSVGVHARWPFPTITSNHFIKRPGGAVPIGVVVPKLQASFLFGCGGRRGQSPAIGVDRPFPTGTGKADTWLAVPTLIRTDMQSAKFSGVFGIQDGLRTITGAGGFALTSALLMRQFGSNVSGRDMRDPHPVVMTEGAGGKSGVVAATLDRAFGGSLPQTPVAPLRTVTANPHDSLISAHLSTYYATGVGSDAADPMRVVTGEDRHALIAAHMEQANTGRVGHEMRAPVSTIMGAGHSQRLIETHLQAIGVAPGSRRRQVLEFLWAHAGEPTEEEWADPLATARGRLRFGLVVIGDQVWEIGDIGMRMLTVRELFGAQGFPPDYIIDRDIKGRAITATDATLMCGNSVSPVQAHALYAANFEPDEPERVAA